MTHYREILRMQAGGFSQRKIAEALQLSRNTVAKTISRAREQSLNWPAIERQGLTEGQLAVQLFPQAQDATPYQQPDCDYMFGELKKTGVSLQMLWLEYCDTCRSNGRRPYMYSRYCDIYRSHLQKTKATMHIPRTPGLQVEVDWAGKCGYLKDPATGDLVPVYIFVAAMSYSQYCYAEGFMDMKLDSWILAHIHLFEFLGGVPKTLVPDNLKTGVTTPMLAEPEIQKNYQELAEHYNTFVMPARIGKPTGKPNVEASVNKFANKLLGTFRNQTFFTLEDFNEQLQAELVKFNSHQFQKKLGSRASLFAEEKDLLAPLPRTRYELALWKTATVQPSYHISVDSMFYSVPFQYISKKLDVKITRFLVEIFSGDTRVCSHKRLYGREGQYSTVKEHMPDKHQKSLDWDDERLIHWGQTYGPATESVIRKILAHYPVSQQGYRSCISLLKLPKEQEKATLEVACQKTLSYTDAPSYQTVKRIFKTLQDQPEAVGQPAETGDEHAFIRNL